MSVGQVCIHCLWKYIFIYEIKQFDKHFVICLYGYVYAVPLDNMCYKTLGFEEKKKHKMKID